MQLVLDLELEEIPITLKALTNERDRSRNDNRWTTAEAIQHAVAQIEEQSRGGGVRDCCCGEKSEASLAKGQHLKIVKFKVTLGNIPSRRKRLEEVLSQGKGLRREKVDLVCFDRCGIAALFLINADAARKA